MRCAASIAEQVVTLLCFIFWMPQTSIQAISSRVANSPTSLISKRSFTRAAAAIAVPKLPTDWPDVRCLILSCASGCYQNWAIATVRHGGVDTSGLGTVDDQITPYPHPHWEETGTDTMHLVLKRKPMRADKNRPQLAGHGVNVLDYREEILAGFHLHLRAAAHASGRVAVR